MRDITGVVQELKKAARDLGLEEFESIIDRLVLNEDDLIPDYADQAALFGYVATRGELIRIHRKKVEASVGGKARAKLRKDMKKIKGLKVTDRAVEELVSTDGDVEEVREVEAFLSALAESFKHRMQMLISMGADLREERKSTSTPLPRGDKEAVMDTLEERATGKSTTPKSRAKDRAAGGKSSRPRKK